MERVITHAEIEEIAATLSLLPLAISEVSPLSAAREDLSCWQQKGFAGQMSYMGREAAVLSDPSKLLPSARSIISFAIFYSGQNQPPLPAGFGRIARYAWGHDYHDLIGDRLKLFVAQLEKHVCHRIEARVFTDTVPLLERAVAARAGLGVVGKNTMLIRPKEGSYFFLAELVCDLALQPFRPMPKISRVCGDCSICLTSCPAGAIVGEHEIDARRCISYLTIEKRQSLSPAERESIGEWVFGCDICQDVCPYNHRSASQGYWAGFEGNCGCGPFLDLGMVLRMRSGQDFRRVFARSPLLRARREGLLRNCAVVAANTGACELIPSLYDAFKQDASGIVRQHCLWALWRLKDSFRVRHLKDVLDQALRDPEEIVRDEAMTLV